MKEIIVFNVGDGMCISCKTVENQYLHIDFGSQKHSLILFNKIIEHIGSFIDINSLVISHMHADHYIGLIFYEEEVNKGRANKANIQTVYAPKLPDFKDSNIFYPMLFAINEYYLSLHSGIIENDLLDIISKINSNPYLNFVPLYQGQSFNLGSTHYKVIWPPSHIESDNFSKMVDNAIRDFNLAIEENHDLHEIFNKIKTGGKWSSLHDTKTIERLDINKSTIHKKNNKDRHIIPNSIEKANKSLRKVANRTSLAFYEDNSFLFMGDLEKEEISKAVNYLFDIESRAYFNTLITPHHGTHWSDELYSIKCKYAISSIGNRLIRNYKTNFSDISSFQYLTYINNTIYLDFDYTILK